MTAIRRCETVVMAMGIALAATVRVAHDGTVGAQASLGPISATGVGASPSPPLLKSFSQLDISDRRRHCCHQ